MYNSVYTQSAQIGHNMYIIQSIQFLTSNRVRGIYQGSLSVIQFSLGQSCMKWS